MTAQASNVAPVVRMSSTRMTDAGRPPVPAAGGRRVKRHGVAQVPEPGCPVEAVLALGRSAAHEGRPDVQAGATGERRGEEMGLVVPAVALPHPVERDRHQRARDR